MYKYYLIEAAVGNRLEVMYKNSSPLFPQSLSGWCKESNNSALAGELSNGCGWRSVKYQSPRHHDRPGSSHRARHGVQTATKYYL